MEKASIIINYFFLIGIGGFGVMLILSILAFCNIEFFKIPNGKNINSGGILLFGALFYGVLSVGLYIKTSRQKASESQRIPTEIMLNTYNNEHKDINNLSEKSKSDEDEEDKKSDERLIDD